MHEKLNCVFAYFDNERERMLLFSFVASKWSSHTQSRLASTEFFRFFRSRTHFSLALALLLSKDVTV